MLRWLWLRSLVKPQCQNCQFVHMQPFLVASLTVHDCKALQHKHWFIWPSEVICCFLFNVTVQLVNCVCFWCTCGLVHFHPSVSPPVWDVMENNTSVDGEFIIVSGRGNILRLDHSAASIFFFSDSDVFAEGVPTRRLMSKKGRLLTREPFLAWGDLFECAQTQIVWCEHARRRAKAKETWRGGNLAVRTNLLLLLPF